MTTYKYPTTLSEDEERIVKKGYGRNAKPILFEDKTPEGLIRQNCPEKCAEKNRANVWQRFAKGLATMKP